MHGCVSNKQRANERKDKQASGAKHLIDVVVLKNTGVICLFEAFVVVQ
jgi:hypothetical protein